MEFALPRHVLFPCIESGQSRRTCGRGCWTSSSSEEVTSGDSIHVTHAVQGLASHRGATGHGHLMGQCLIPCQRALQSPPQPHVPDVTLPALLSTPGHHRRFVPCTTHRAAGVLAAAISTTVTPGLLAKLQGKIPMHKSNCKAL